MAFGNGAFLKIWGVTDKGNYAEVEVSSSKKNKQTGEYETDFNSKYVRFVGDAYHCRPMNGQKIKIVECAVTNCYKGNDGKTAYLKNPNYVVFRYELQDGSNTTNSANTDLSTLTEVNEVLPF